MSEPESFGKGVWCIVCQVFEDKENLEDDPERCMGCGCSHERHAEVEVVKTDA